MGNTNRLTENDVVKGLTENDVVKAISVYLCKNGCTIDQQLTTSQRGTDLIASDENVTWYVEAKGATSSKPGTNRYGKPFSNSQIKDHVSCAIYAAMEILGRKPAGVKTRAALGLPDNNNHRSMVEPIQEALNRLEIAVFWVAGAQSVELKDPRQA